MRLAIPDADKKSKSKSNDSYPHAESESNCFFKKYRKNSQNIIIFNTISVSVKRSSVTAVTNNNGGSEMIYFVSDPITRPSQKD